MGRHSTFEQALDVAGQAGAWRWDVDLDRLTGNARLAELFDVDPQVVAQGVSLQRMINRIHPADRPTVDQAIGLSVEDGNEFSATYRIGCRNETRWIHARGRCFESGRSLRGVHVGVAFDITAFRQGVDGVAMDDDFPKRLDRIAHHCLMAHHLASEAGLEPITMLLRPLLHEVGMRIAREQR